MREIKAMPARTKRYAIGLALAVVVACGLAIGWRLSNAKAKPPQSAPEAAATGNPAPAEPSNPEAPSGEMPTTAKITFSTVPPANASVTWGKQTLGRIAPHAALVIVRPRDSGPLDVVVRSPGFLPVHTRAHTFADSTVTVKLTRPDQKNTLFGYKEPLDAGPPGGEAPGATDMQQPPQ
jgi:hypothetical protein